MIDAVIALAAAISSYLIVLAVRAWMNQHQIYDMPNARSSHVRPTPRGGGLGIVVGVVGGLLLWRSLAQPPWIGAALLALLLSALIIAGTGWLDDLRSLGALLRFAIHAGAAVAAIWGVSRVFPQPLAAFGPNWSAWLMALVAFLWIVGLTNTYNFMDGIDGLAGSQGLVAGLGWALLGSVTGWPIATAVGLFIAAGCAGFLLLNWPPASIFMGDVGSGFLGFSFATLTLIAASAHLALALAGALLLWPFLFDSIFTFLCRAYRRENVLAAHRSHLYQRLVIAGFSHRQVTLLYVALDLTGLALALGVVLLRNPAFLLPLPAFCWLLWQFVVQQEKRSAPSRFALTKPGR